MQPVILCSDWVCGAKALIWHSPPLCSCVAVCVVGPWLNAWHDTVANVKAFSPCVRLADLNATGEYLLLIADADKKLKVYKGTSLASEHALLDVPSALAIFYTDLNKPQTPSVAVAAGSYIFIYRNLRPY